MDLFGYFVALFDKGCVFLLFIIIFICFFFILDLF